MAVRRNYTGIGLRNPCDVRCRLRDNRVVLVEPEVLVPHLNRVSLGQSELKADQGRAIGRVPHRLDVLGSAPHGGRPLRQRNHVRAGLKPYPVELLINPRFKQGGEFTGIQGCEGVLAFCHGVRPSRSASHRPASLRLDWPARPHAWPARVAARTFPRVARE